MLTLAIILATLATPEPAPAVPVAPVYQCVDQSYQEFLGENPDAEWVDYELYRKLCGLDATYLML